MKVYKNTWPRPTVDALNALARCQAKCVQWLVYISMWWRGSRRFCVWRSRPVQRWWRRCVKRMRQKITWMRIITKMVSGLFHIRFWSWVACCCCCCCCNHKTHTPPLPPSLLSVPLCKMLYEGLSAAYFSGSIPVSCRAVSRGYGYLLNSHHD